MLELRGQIAITGANLGGRGFVFGRHALHRVRDSTVDQLESVMAIAGLRLVREPEAVQRPIQERSCEIAGERPPRRVCTVKAGCETYDDESRVRIAERCDGRAVVVRICFPSLGVKRGQSRALRARAVEYYAVGRPEAVSCGPRRNIRRSS